MGRKVFQRERYKQKGESDVNHHWISYSDLMSALLLMFILLLMLSMLNQQKSMAERKEAIEKVTGVKSSIIEELNKEFTNSNLEMQVDLKTGAIRFSSEVFFEFDSATISEEGKQHLREFIPRYISVLLGDSFEEHIAEVIVEGHTDQQGSYIYNLDLSQNRSLAVVKEVFSKDFPAFKEREQLKGRITANGRSFSEPIYNHNGGIDAKRSRRVEFKFRLKSDETVEKIREMVQ